MLALTAVVAAAALGAGRLRPLGIALGGGAATLDLVLIRRLVVAALIRRPPLSRVVSVAFAKSLLLILVPAAALLLPATLVDGLSFAVGVSALPLAVVVDALLPAPGGRPVGPSLAS